MTKPLQTDSQAPYTCSLVFECCAASLAIDRESNSTRRVLVARCLSSGYSAHKRRPKAGLADRVVGALAVAEVIGAMKAAGLRGVCGGS